MVLKRSKPLCKRVLMSGAKCGTTPSALSHTATSFRWHTCYAALAREWLTKIDFIRSQSSMASLFSFVFIEDVWVNFKYLPFRLKEKAIK